MPQLAGLGRSPTAQTYALASLAHARAYLEHPVLEAQLEPGTRCSAGALTVFFDGQPDARTRELLAG